MNPTHVFCRLPALVVSLLALTLAGGACDVQKKDASSAATAPAAQAAPAPSTPPATGTVPAAAKTDAAKALLPLIQPTPPGQTPVADLQGADAEVAAIRKYLDDMPRDFSGIAGGDADRIAADSEATLGRTGLFIERHKTHPGLPEVQFVRAKLLYILSGRYRQELIVRLRVEQEEAAKKGQAASADLGAAIKVQTGKYFAEVESLARASHEKLPADHRLRPLALELVGQAASEGERYEEARQAYQKFQEEFPSHEEVDQVTLALGRACLELSRYDEAIHILKGGMERFFQSPQYPFFVETLRKTYHSKGDLEGLLEVCRTVDTVHPLKLQNKDLKQQDRDTLARFLSFNGFWKGYALLGKGDFAAARDAFKAHIDYVTAKEKSLEAEKKQLKPEEVVYRMRSQTCLTFVEEVAGLPVPVDFDLGNAWGTPKQVRVTESRGKVVAIVFRAVGDDRSAPFVSGLWEHCQKLGDVEMVVISYRKGQENLAQQLDELRDELARIGYEGPAGLDPDATDKAIFRRFKVNVGSATFVIANRRGELVWYQQDPRAIDVDFARTMIESVGKR